jgi:hypothetical protein
MVIETIKADRLSRLAADEHPANSTLLAFPLRANRICTNGVWLNALIRIEQS